MKVVALISKDETLMKICGRIDGRRAQLQEKLKFVQKQAQDLIDTNRKQSENDFQELADYLVGTGVIEKYDRDKQNIQFSLETDAIHVFNKSDQLCGHQILENLLT